MPQEEQQAHPTNEDAQMHLEEAEKEETWFDEGEEEEEEDASALDMTDEEAQAWEQGSGLTAEEDYVTSGNRVVLDACDDLFEMVEEEMKVLRQASELLELLGVSMGSPGTNDGKAQDENEEEEGPGEEP